MQSIYKTILAMNRPVNVVPMFDYGYEDDYDYDYEEKPQLGNGDIVEAIPLKRDMLIYGTDGDAEVENIEDLESAIIHYPVKKLDEYDDGDLYIHFPIAVKFSMDVHGYYKVVNSGAGQRGTLSIAHFGPHYDLLFDSGVIVSAFKNGDKMEVIAGFKQEGHRD